MKTLNNLIWQFFGNGIGSACMFLFYLLLPAVIGLNEYGNFAFAFAVTMIVFQIFFGDGLDMVVVKMVRRERADVIRMAFIIRTCVGLLAILLLLTISRFIMLYLPMLLVIAFYFVLLSFQNIIFSYYRGIEQMKLQGFVTAVQKMAALLLIWPLCYLNVQSKLIGPVALVISVILGSSILLWPTVKVLRSTFRPDIQGGYDLLLKESLLLSMITFLGIIHFRIDSVMIGLIRENQEVGIYNIGYKIMEVSIFMPSIIMMVYFPKLVISRKFKGTLTRLVVVLGFLGLLTSALFYYVGPMLIKYVYPSEFWEAISVLRILSFSIISISIGQATALSLVALNLTSIYLLVAFLSTATNIVLNLLFIPRTGYIGAAWATVATEAMVVLLSLYFIWRNKNLPTSQVYSNLDFK